MPSLVMPSALAVLVLFKRFVPPAFVCVDAVAEPTLPVPAPPPEEDVPVAAPPAKVIDPPPPEKISRTTPSYKGSDR
mgnify:CR=1 FL=1